jgi:hypothetical protein
MTNYQFVARCVTPGNTTYLGSNNRQIALLFEVSSRTLDTLNRVAAVLPEVLRDMQLQHPRWINVYHLAVYNSTCMQN